MRILAGYTESHHILPRCMGGNNDATNLVELTPEEHFVAHQLLIKMHPGVDKLVFAAKMMTIGSNNHQRGNKLYGWLRRRFIESISRPCSEQTKAKIGAANKGKGGSRREYTAEHREAISKTHSGKIVSAETRLKISTSSTGKKLTEDHRKKLSLAKLGKKVGPYSAERIERAASANRGKKRSEETRKKIGDSKRGENSPMLGKHHSDESKKKASNTKKNAPRLTCPHCAKIGARSQMKRYHFDNCKKNLNSIPTINSEGENYDNIIRSS